MSNVNPYSPTDTAVPAAFADESARATFIRRTYTHLLGAVMALIGIEFLLFSLVPPQTMSNLVGKMTGVSWLLVLGVFMAVSWLARYWAQSGASKTTQYAGLGLYVIAEAMILLPMLYLAITYVGPQTPLFAALITIACFGGLTAFVFMTGADLASWGKYLALFGIAAFAAIIIGAFMGFSLGLWFSVAMVALACGYILYDTSNILHHYRTDQHVAASLALFASVVLLFWYVLRILMYVAAEE